MHDLQKYISYMKELFEPGSKIVVAMSGGVDSSLTAALIKLAGFETIGITLQLYRSKAIAQGKTCCAGKDIEDAKSVAQAQGFKHYVLDYTQLFQEHVINDFANTYEKGATPIPCGRCNQYIKFGYLLDFAKSIEADYLVTGHYVEKLINGNVEMLMRSADKVKDQSYFLALTNKEQLKMLHFPLAKIEKTVVKELSKQIGLKTAQKAESQDICFIPDGDYKKFLKNLRPEMFVPGDILTSSGKKLGTHEGLAGYTIGQRRSLNLNDGPWYVVNLNTSNNALIVGRIEELKHNKFEIEELNLLVEPEFFKNKTIDIQIRAHQPAAPGFFDIENNVVHFYDAQSAITPGQICAFYENIELGNIPGERLIGGGIIKQQL
jgi:tRNA-specific 2-thiouridylase